MCDLQTGAGCLDMADHIAGVLTAIVAVLAFAHYQLGRWRRRRKLVRYLDRYLLSVKGDAARTGKLTAFHLMSVLHMTESEVLEAAFTSEKVRAWRIVDRQTGRSVGIMFSSAKLPMPKFEIEYDQEYDA
ncbi:MAG: hypothetical protein CL949_07120 [Erythrobacter sp.]|nr:hypothetical protein [Erythrobacter sp.]